MRAPAAPQLPAEDDTVGRLILKDGSVAVVRPAATGDLPLLAEFFQDLSPESRHQRFLSGQMPAPALLRTLSDSADPHQAFTLIALRQVQGRTHIVATGSYLRASDTLAEVAFAVDDAFRGRGLATAILERLSVEAARHGFRAFRATTLADNLAMQDVFQRSGFRMTAVPDADAIDVELAIAPTVAGLTLAEERERTATVASIRPFFEPLSIAVVGASRDPAAIGRRVLDAIAASGFTGSVYAINPNADRVGTLRAWPSVRAVGLPVESAVIAVPREHVLDAVDDCAAAGVRTLIVISAGFAEADERGRELQRQLVDKARGCGLRLIGPNCMGVINASEGHRLNASFSPVMPPDGHLAFSSQSGALGILLVALASSRGVGLSSFASVGNKADVSGNDLLQYWEADPRTAVIGLYLESFGNARRFARLARRVARTKPIVAVKAGRTEAGARAAGSHTAALAASDAAVTALFKQTGVIRAESIAELFDVAACLESQPLPSGRRVAIVTNAGGPGILAADACQAAGLTVTPFSPRLQADLSALLPPGASVANPVDMIASASPAHYGAVAGSVLASTDADVLLLLYTSVDTGSAPAILTAIESGIAEARAAGHRSIPALACVMAVSAPPVLHAGGERVPVYAFPEDAARALGRIVRYAEWRRAPAGTRWTFDDQQPEAAEAICRAAAARGDEWLEPGDVRRLLEAFGIALVPSVVVHNAEDAVTRGHELGWPVVLKLCAASIVHKSDVGGVIPRLESPDDVRRAFATLEERARIHGVALEGVLVQPMIASGIETMVGVAHDPIFGPLVGFGLGGTDVEVLDDVRFRVVPLTDRDAAALVAETRAARLLAGTRGRPAGDVAAVNELLLRVSSLAEHTPTVAEIDLNPVIVLPAGQGYRIVDARIRLRR